MGSNNLSRHFARRRGALGAVRLPVRAEVRRGQRRGAARARGPRGPNIAARRRSLGSSGMIKALQQDVTLVTHGSAACRGSPPAMVAIAYGTAVANRGWQRVIRAAPAAMPSPPPVVARADRPQPSGANRPGSLLIAVVTCKAYRHRGRRP